MGAHPDRLRGLIPLRLEPGEDLRDALRAWATVHGSAFVVAGIGSLHDAALRFAAKPQADLVGGPLELLTLSGSLAADGVHLHASVADAQGRVWAGHVASGCRVRTTAELLLAPLPDWNLTRVLDAGTGYAELVVAPR